MSAEALLNAARAVGVTITTAESCTGGLVAGAITTPPGASDIFREGFVTYSNAAKIRALGVSAATLDAYGAVSQEVAREMAIGARERAEADIAVSITGIAGPGGSDFKPEGRVCFGLSTVEGTQAETVDFGALGRDAVRQHAVDHALGLLLKAIP